MELSQEKFQAVKELAEVQGLIATGRATLEKIKEDTKSYLELREVAAHERVEKVLKESVEALESTNKNHAELALYASGLRAMALELSGFSQEIVTLFRDFRKRLTESEMSLAVRLEQVKEQEKDARLVLGKIAADRETLDADFARLRDEKRLFADRKQLLEKGLEEFKKLRANQK